MMMEKSESRGGRFADGAELRTPSISCEEGDKIFSRLKAKGGGRAKAGPSSRNYFYSSPAQIPFDWEAAPGKPKQEEERAAVAAAVAALPPLSPPPMMQSPATSRTPSFASDRWRTNSSRVTHDAHAAQIKGKLQILQNSNSKRIAQTPPPQQQNDQYLAKKNEVDEEFFSRGCIPFSFRRGKTWSISKLLHPRKT